MRRVLLLLALLAIGAGDASAQDPRISGSITAGSGASSYVRLQPLLGRGTGKIQITAICTCTLVVEGSVDGTTFGVIQLTASADGAVVAASQPSATGIYTIDASGLRAVQVRASAFTSGTATIAMQVSSAGGGGGGAAATITGGVTVGNVGITSIAAGNNNIGDVDVASSALPTGASTAAKQDTGNTSLASIDGKITTVNTGAVVVSSSALPTGASTAANQSTANGSLSSIDTKLSSTATAANQSTEITALQLIDDLPNTQGSTTSGQKGALVQGAVTTSAPTYTTAQTSPLSLDTAGALRVAITSGAGSGGTAAADGSTYTAGTTNGTPSMGFYEASPSTVTTGKVAAVGLTAKRAMRVSLEDASGTALTPATDATADSAASTTGPQLMGYGKATAPTAMSADGDATPIWTDLNGRLQSNTSQINGVAPSMGNGASGTGVQRVTLANDSTGQVTLAAGSATIGALTANQSVNLAQVGGTSASFANGSAGSGTLRVTIASDSNGVIGLNAGSNLIGQVAGVATATTTNTTASCYITSAASNNATNCKSSAGNLYSIQAVNTTATLYFLRLYNLSASPTCSSSTGFVRTIPIPASTTGAGIVIPQDVGEAFGTGLGFCLTAGGANNDNTSAATGVYLTLLYK